MNEAFRHPEWKRLFDAICIMVAENSDKKVFSYEELEMLAGIDIRTSRGRKQFERFNRECRSNLNIHWENVREKGYRIVESTEHAMCATRRIKKASKQLKRGKHIAESTDLSKLTTEQVKAVTLVAACIGILNQNLQENTKAIKKLANVMEQPKLIEKAIVDSTLEQFKVKEEMTH